MASRNTNIKIKPRICLLFFVFDLTVNANSLKENIIVIKEMFLAATLVG